MSRVCSKDEKLMKNKTEPQISDLNVYLNKMQKSVIDKIFFIDKVFEPFENIVDFGCANGELIKAVHALFGDEYKYCGYDINPEMIKAARVNIPFATIVSEWDRLDVPFDKSLLNISSTIHEIYSYCKPEEIEQFWARVFRSGFKYITIRDMMVSENCSADADEKEIALVRGAQRYAEHLRDYENVRGTIKSQKDLIHFLLKYKYTENWEREVREDYLGLHLEEFLKLIHPEYEITFFDHFTLPFIAWQIKNDFNIDLKTPTHIKIILKKS